MRCTAPCQQPPAARAVQHLVEHAPSTGGLALWMRRQNLEDEAEAPASTDVTVLSYTPDFAPLALTQQTAGVAHGGGTPEKQAVSTCGRNAWMERANGMRKQNARIERAA